MWNFITVRQTSGKRMVFHSGKWKFVGKKHNMTYDFLIHTFSDMTYSWPDQITPGSGKLLASGLPMSKTWRLRFEVLFKTDDRVTHRTIFHGTDGKGFSHTRCGGRLPGIWTKASAYPDLRHDFCWRLSRLKLYRLERTLYTGIIVKVAPKKSIFFYWRRLYDLYHFWICRFLKSGQGSIPAVASMATQIIVFKPARQCNITHGLVSLKYRNPCWPLNC